MKTTNMVPSRQHNPSDKWFTTTQTNGDDCRESGVKLTLPFPPSVNTYWRNTSKGVLISASGRSFRSNAIASVYQQLKRRPKPITVGVEVSVILYPPSRQSRDLDNYLKALFDSMTHAGIWLDDKQVKRFTVEWGEVVKGGRSEVTISEYQAVAA